MSTLALVDARTWIGGHDWTTDSNRIALNAEVDELEKTTFGGGGYRSRQAGLRTVAAELAGYWDSDADAAAFTDLGTVDRVVTMSPDGEAESAAYLFQAGIFQYAPFGGIGTVAPFSLTMSGTNRVGLVRGQVAVERGAVSATGAIGSALNLGAPTATQSVYVALHVFTAGTTITIDVESDDAEAFTDPTTQDTIGPITTTGGTWLAIPGAISGETWWRLNVTAATGTFNLAAALAVQ